MSPALPGTCDLLSVLQEALSNGDRNRVRLNRHVRAMAADFLLLVDSLVERPIRLRELVPIAPVAIGACGICQAGMGRLALSRARASRIVASTFSAPFFGFSRDFPESPGHRHDFRFGVNGHHRPQGHDCHAMYGHPRTNGVDRKRQSGDGRLADQGLVHVDHRARLLAAIQRPSSAAPQIRRTPPLHSGARQFHGG